MEAVQSTSTSTSIFPLEQPDVQRWEVLDKPRANEKLVVRQNNIHEFKIPGVMKVIIYADSFISGKGKGYSYYFKFDTEESRTQFRKTFNVLQDYKFLRADSNGDELIDIKQPEAGFWWGVTPKMDWNGGQVHTLESAIKFFQKWQSARPLCKEVLYVEHFRA